MLGFRLGFGLGPRVSQEAADVDEESELDGEAEGDEGVEHEIDLEHLVRGRVRGRG